jgi:hypothetical protein
MNDHKSSIIFDLDGTKPQFSIPYGNRTIMNADNFPVLKGWEMSYFAWKKVEFGNPTGIRMQLS